MYYMIEIAVIRRHILNKEFSMATCYCGHLLNEIENDYICAFESHDEFWNRILQDNIMRSYVRSIIALDRLATRHNLEELRYRMAV